MRSGPRRTAAGLLTALALLLGLTPAQFPYAHAEDNLALGKSVTASGQETDWWGPEQLVDGDAGPADATPPEVHRATDASRWSANQADHVWATVDLAAQVRPSEIRLRWGNTFSTDYSLLGSLDGVAWQPLATKAVGERGAWRTHRIDDAPTVRYVKLESFAKSQQWSLSVWELEVRGTVVGDVEAPFTTAITPRPASQAAGEHGDYTLGEDTAVVASGAAAPVATHVAETLRASTGLALPIRTEGAGLRFVLDADTVREPEGYTLTSGEDGVTVTAGTVDGLRHGAESLLQLLGPWSHAAEVVVQDWVVPGVTISDAPRYPWRGFMLDVSRNFFTVAEVEQLLDQMAQFKLNVLHLHLSDDQGWRLAISNEGKAADDPIDYSLLTTVSGGTAMAPTKWTAKQGTPGFYTAEQFRAILDHAEARGIAVVPEIDMPGHTNAILHAIPQMNTDGTLPKRQPGEATVPPQTTPDVGESALDANAEITYRFIEHVVGQILAEYPTSVHGERFFHLGGDETHKMNADNPENYRTFMRRATGIVERLGATGIVWNEAAASAKGALADGLVIQHWSSMDGVADYVNNHDGRVLMSPASAAYLPQIPGNVLGPNWACGGPCALRQFYQWDPTARAGVPEERVLGVEAPIWGEHLRSWAAAEYLVFPRLAATAEVGWTPQAGRSFDEFRTRVGALGTLLTVQGRNFFPEDGDWTPEARAIATEPVAEGEPVGEVAVASIPQVRLADVRATATFTTGPAPVRGVRVRAAAAAGTTAQVTVTNARDFLPGAGKTFDDRSAAQLFRFAIDETLPAGTHTGTLTITHPGGTLEVPLSVVVRADEPSEPAPSDEPTPPTPSEEPTTPVPGVTPSEPDSPSPVPSGSAPAEPPSGEPTPTEPAPTGPAPSDAPTTPGGARPGLPATGC